jgi:hypothetical protein
VRNRGPVLVFLATFVVLFAVLAIPYLFRDRDVLVATPTPPPLFQVTEVGLHSDADICLSGLRLGPGAQVLRLRTDAPVTAPVPLIGVRAAGPGYRSVQRVRPTIAPGRLEVPLVAPSRELVATLCLHTFGKPVSLVGTTESRSVSPVSTHAGKRPIEADPTVQILRRAPASLASRLGDVVRHASAFHGRPIGPVLLGAIALALLIGLPLALAVALAQAPAEPVRRRSA